MPTVAELKQKYGDQKVQEAIDYLSYKKATELPKCDESSPPILYVFRHGQTTDNAEYIFSGWRDPELTQKGVEDAQILAAKLQDKKFDVLIASDQKRAYETMRIAMSVNPKARNLPIIQDPRIKERSYGDLQGKSKLELQLLDPALLKQMRRSYDISPPNGESIAMVVGRVTEFIEELLPLMRQQKLNVAVSCHGNSIRGFRKYFEKLSEVETATVESPLAKDYASYLIV